MTVRLDLRPDRLDGEEELAAKRAWRVCGASVCVFALCAIVFVAAAVSSLYKIESFPDFYGCS